MSYPKQPGQDAEAHQRLAERCLLLTKQRNEAQEEFAKEKFLREQAEAELSVLKNQLASPEPWTAQESVADELRELRQAKEQAEARVRDLERQLEEVRNGS